MGIEVFITGLPRSGTTAMKELFNTNNHVEILHEAGIYMYWDKPEAFKKRTHEMKQLHIILDKTPQEAIQSISSLTVYGDKMPLNGMEHYSFVHKIIERKAKTIFMVRNPFDNIRSRIDRVKKNDGFPKKLGENLQVAQDNWIEAFNCQLRMMDTLDDFLVIRYEDSVDNPNNTVRNINEFLGTDLVFDTSNYRPIHVNQYDYTKDQFSQKFLSYARMMGYEL